MAISAPHGTRVHVSTTPTPSIEPDAYDAALAATDALEFGRQWDFDGDRERVCPVSPPRGESIGFPTRGNTSAGVPFRPKYGLSHSTGRRNTTPSTAKSCAGWPTRGQSSTATTPC